MRYFLCNLVSCNVFLTRPFSSISYISGSTGAGSCKTIDINGKVYERDKWTNVTPHILSKLNRNLHRNRKHPIGIITARICEFLHNATHGSGQMLSIYDSISPVVTVRENFDELLIGRDHISREKTDSYYINSDTLLRSHTSAHEADLIRSGLNAFLIIGDVYRRDEIDMVHYPVFHQLEGVRLFNRFQLFKDLPENDPAFDQFILDRPSLRLDGQLRPPHSQERHGEATARILESELKSTLEELASHLLGKDVNYRWVPAYFPWTHPSYELEIEVKPNVWMEMLGCGIIEQDMLDRCGAHDRVGIAFGLGLERWAMRLFNISDIRLFWSTDQGFLYQFNTDDIHTPIKYKPISIFPPVLMDISFWLPTPQVRDFHDNDFYEVVGSIAGDLVERVEIVDKYEDKKRQRKSNCYRIVYRHMSRNLTQKEINVVHSKIAQEVQAQLCCVVR